MTLARPVIGGTVLVCVALAGPAAAQARRGPQPPAPGVYKATIVPHWFERGTRFWYRNDLPGKKREFVLVDAVAGTRRPAFDHARLAAALGAATGESHASDALPFDAIEFGGAKDGAILIKVADTTWRCDLHTYRCARSEAAIAPLPSESEEPTGPPRPRRGPGTQGGVLRESGAQPVRSPDGEWTAVVKDDNVVVRRDADGQEIRLSTDGTEAFFYGGLSWSPDSRTLVAFRVEPGERKEVYRIESSPASGGRAVLHRRPYHLPGDRYDSLELNLFDVATGRQTRPRVDRIDFGGGGRHPRPEVRWQKDARSFTYQKVDRGHQRFRLVEVDARTGEPRNIIDEKSETFIWTAHTENLDLELVNWLQKSNEIIYVSERSGWRHLYLVDAGTGAIRPITRGEFVLRGIDRIDEDERRVYFRASGREPGQHPYFIHYYRVNFDGSGLVALTEGDGTHRVQLSPDRRFLIDTYSRVDLPPVHTLRRTEDGRLVVRLEEADVTELRATGWEPPEVFVPKGRDGRTDIWGIITRPPRLDPGKKYPVLESIYNGPQSAYVPKSFSGRGRFAALNDLGFIVVQMDAMGTAWRSKAFHDVCWRNLGDAGFPDRILWHQAAAARYAYYDLERVGIFGNSAGGQNAAGAVIFHPEFYKALANSGCHDNRMDKASWNEQWMGYPVGGHYSASSNVDNAAKLGGRLLLIVGEMDDNVPPESTYRLVDALVKAGKDFELLVVPGAGHGSPSIVTQRRLQDFFVHHLQGVEAPDRNATAAGPASGAPDR
jgi:dipeptidyl aminopeptidase/acylaminoacyl peptidase